MQHKNNPWVSLVALLLLALILVLTCTGCRAAIGATSDRFTREVHSIDDAHHVTIITDTETGDRYMFYKAYNAGGLCKLEG